MESGADAVRCRLSYVRDPDVIVVGSGPNGLVAANVLSRRGFRVLVLEANARRPGGALGSEELTRPGFVHDVGVGCVARIIVCNDPTLKRQPGVQHEPHAFVPGILPVCQIHHAGACAEKERVAVPSTQLLSGSRYQGVDHGWQKPDSVAELRGDLISIARPMRT